jgi:hypothetical protein
VSAGNIAALAKGDDLADLAQHEPDSLRGADELEPTDRVVVVVLVAAGGPLGRGQNADLFVVSQCLDARPATAG